MAGGGCVRWEPQETAPLYPKAISCPQSAKVIYKTRPEVFTLSNDFIIRNRAFLSIAKQDFYKGAALVVLIEDIRCVAVRSRTPGYIVNNDLRLLIKYSTHARSPWRFAITDEEVRFLRAEPCQICRTFVALVCGGDGVCALTGEIVLKVTGSIPSTISVSRRYHGQYWIAGPVQGLDMSVPVNAWPGYMFDLQRDD